MITLNSIYKKYLTEEIETTALNGVDLNIHQGEFIAIMGPSGCGKSTLLNILGMLDTPASGSYLFKGQEIAGLNERKRAAIRKNNIGFIFQSFNLIDELTVGENIQLALQYIDIDNAEKNRKVKQVMERLSIAHRASHFPKQLSGGQQQRVAIARATVCDPSIILADEPTGNLDSKSGKEVMSLLSELHNRGTSIVMVTHSAEQAEIADRIVTLRDGQIFNGKLQDESTNQPLLAIAS
ncbi:MAG: ABC transporter ATP-binding protein [Pseudomonadota bacterium]